MPEESLDFTESITKFSNSLPKNISRNNFSETLETLFKTSGIDRSTYTLLCTERPLKDGYVCAIASNSSPHFEFIYLNSPDGDLQLVLPNQDE